MCPPVRQRNGLRVPNVLLSPKPAWLRAPKPHDTSKTLARTNSPYEAVDVAWCQTVSWMRPPVRQRNGLRFPNVLLSPKPAWLRAPKPHDTSKTLAPTNSPYEAVGVAWFMPADEARPGLHPRIRLSADVYA